MCGDEMRKSRHSRRIESLCTFFLNAYKESDLKNLSVTVAYIDEDCDKRVRMDGKQETVSSVAFNGPPCKSALDVIDMASKQAEEEKVLTQKGTAEKKRKHKASEDPQAEKRSSKEQGPAEKKQNARMELRNKALVASGDKKNKLAVGVVNDFIEDMSEKLPEEAGRLARYNGKCTITGREIQSAVRLVLPGELAKFAITDGTKAVSKFISPKKASPE
ncbi:hypothetical protein IFM89_007526 [Coptis chinensis]|uniref:Core Histone H2A/H2B/H3 domain-containing protein n=1 Tax=Coptis chinensis TaxID=261450 RepID=A0A835LUN7_9MAGN|nr:hypothetical protein IFM89_007526 [Coptis chinensis]